MPLLATNEAERQIEHAVQTRIMASVEARYIPRLLREFQRVGRESAKEYAANLSIDGSILAHQDRLSKILGSLYTTSTKSSMKHVQNETSKSEDIYFETKGILESFRNLAGWFGTLKLTRSGEISKTTADIIEKTIEGSLVNEEGETESIDTISRNIAKSTGGSVMGYRAERVARTETLVSFNRANLESTKELDLPDGVTLLKKWLPAGGSRTRDTHRRMRNHEAIPMNADFRVGSSKGEYPGDPSLPADEVINCRCVLVYEEDVASQQ